MRRLARVLDDPTPDIDHSSGVQSRIRVLPPPEASTFMAKVQVTAKASVDESLQAAKGLARIGMAEVIHPSPYRLIHGSAPGPTIQVMKGDRVRIIVDNHLPEATSMHWHGFEIPNDMDGAPGSSQDPIAPGGRFVYEFTLNQEGTYFYHSHMAMQEMMGMIGAFIMHPKEPYRPGADKDFVIVMQEYAILPNINVPNSMNMEFNWLTFNGKSGPATTPLAVRPGERVRIRLINLGMDHHPIHLHGHQFVVTGTEGGRQPESTWGPGNTVLVGVAQSRDVEFVANNPGDWMLHCHLPHHMMNQMSSNVGPVSRRVGMPAGEGMEQGMGMPRRGSGRGNPRAQGRRRFRKPLVGQCCRQMSHLAAHTTLERESPDATEPVG
jgi:manganese oxidase